MEGAAKDAEIAAYRAEIAAKDAEIAAKDAEIAAHRAEIAAHRAEIAAHRAEISRLKLAVEEMNEKLLEVETNFADRDARYVENPTATAVLLPEQQISGGTATPMGPHDDMTTMGVFWYNGQKPEHIDHAWFNGGFGCNRPVRPDYSSGPNRILWAAAHNQFFTVTLVPANTNSYGSQFAAHRINLPPPSGAEIAADSKVVREPHGR